MNAVAEAIRETVFNGIDFLRDNFGVAAGTFLIQICATIALFLIVRWKFWPAINGILEKRQAAIDEALAKQKEATENAARVTEEADAYKAKVLLDAQSLLARTTDESRMEAKIIIGQALRKIELAEKNSMLQLEREREKMNDAIANEIIEVGYQLAKKILSDANTPGVNREVVNKYLKDYMRENQGSGGK